MCLVEGLIPKLLRQLDFACLFVVDFTKLPKPKKTNKGKRGQLLELALGIANTSKLTDCVDGELKSFTQGESIAVTQLKHILPQIFANIPIYRTKLGIKTQQTLFVGFDRDNNFLGTATHTETDKLLEGDYQYICEIIRHKIGMGQPLSTITGLNGVLQIRTKDSKDRHGNYHPIKWEGKEISNKGYAFYLTSKYAKNIV